MIELLKRYVETWRNFDKLTLDQKYMLLDLHFLVPPALYFTVVDTIQYLSRVV